ncbi:EAL domain-containing protein [Pseudoduganella sp. GCM10020061]|uniref:bifunctional diguanylate cyclase/phosphodiesterase n=1 Tax=Pseudoduganella sp. GCM10020061 TaxID=3317345 RepID=UPI00362C0807
MLRRPSFQLTFAAALTLAVGIAATFLLFATVARLEFEQRALAFQQRVDVRVAAIRQGLDQAVEVVNATNHLFGTIDPVTRQQFHDFTAPLLARYPFITAFNYHRRITHAERPALEAELQKVVPGTVLTENNNGVRSVAPWRPSYIVVDYLEPMRGNERGFGLNVEPYTAVMDALDLAVRTGRPASTTLISLAQDTEPLRAFEIILPVYKRGMPLDSAELRREALLGDTAAIIRPSRLVEGILQDSALLSNDTSVRVFASVDGNPRAMVFEHTVGTGPDASDRFGSRMAQWLGVDHADTAVATLDVAGRQWRIEIGSSHGPLTSAHTGSLMSLVGGLLVTLAFAAFVQVLVRRSQRVQALVADRTADLKRSNEQLIEDVIARKRTERALQDSEQRFRQLVNMSSDWYWEQDAQLRFVHISNDLREKAGVGADRLVGKTRWEAVPCIEQTESGRRHIELVKQHLPFTNFEYTMVDDQGAVRWFCINGQPVFDEQGMFSGYRGTGTDITSRKQAEQRIHHVAQHDVLTGLPNRSLLQDRLSQAIAYADRSRYPVWVMLVDLDRFKFVNDSMGHKAGDVLLMTVAARLRSALREHDTVARLSGDEFVVIVSATEEQALTPMIVERLMESVAQPVMLGTKEFTVSCSIGVAVYPSGGTPADSLIEHADIAMYRAKKLGRNNFQFYTPAMNEEAMERVRIEGALRKALERNEFVLHYQPQVDLKTGQVCGMEALLRWQHPELGMVPPNRFIGVAEETGLIVPIGLWVLRTACEQNKQWQREPGFERLRVAVNLSARQFSSPHLIEDIRAVLDDTGLAPESLEIELTESLFMTDIAQAVDMLHQMKRQLGVNLSIDDFGTGYSSLSYLSRFPIDVLKIDRSFVNDIAHDGGDAAIVTSIIALAHNLKLAVIAEGVETAEQLEYLSKHGCDEMQGYYFSPPLPAAEFYEVIRQRKALAVPVLDVPEAA